MSKRIPRSNEDDYSLDIVQQRQAFIEQNTAATLDHTRQFSFDPCDMSGNIDQKTRKNEWVDAHEKLGRNK